MRFVFPWHSAMDHCVSQIEYNYVHNNDPADQPGRDFYLRDWESGNYWSAPAAYNDRAELSEVEPYVHAQTTYSTCSPRAGTARTPWLTGAAAWAYYSATHDILGLQP
jgi:Glycosyl hydrolase 36 superfamily, catalytic domain/Glycosyltransferase family 36